MVLTVNIHTCGSIQPLSFMSPAWLPIRVVFTLSALHGYSGRDCVAARKRDIIHLKLTECYMSIMSIKLRKNPHSPDGLSWHDRPSLSCPRQCMSTFCDVQWPTPFSELSLSFSHLLYLQTCLVRSAVYPLCAMIPWGWSWTLKLYPRLLFTLSLSGPQLHPGYCGLLDCWHFVLHTSSGDNLLHRGYLKTERAGTRIIFSKYSSDRILLCLRMIAN